MMDASGRRKAYTFADRYTAVIMPWDVAQRLVGAEGFRVCDKHDQEIKKAVRTGREANLGIQETIARFEELTSEALQARAIKVSGITQSKAKKMKKDELIDLLVSSSVGVVNPEPSTEGSTPLASQEEEIDENEPLELDGKF